MTVQSAKCKRFAELHQRDGAFLIPNPWDVGSAKMLAGLGFEALATTSAGLAYTLGKADGEVTLIENLQHCELLAGATSIPINADFENGFADEPQDVVANVMRVAETGVAGCSIEDFDRDAHTIYDIGLATERIHAAVAAVASMDMPFLLTARAENFIRDNYDIDDTIKRLQAFSAAGADVLYAPGLASLEQVRQVRAEVETPLNVLAPFIAGATVAELTAAGAKRISVGSALNSVAINSLLRAGSEMLDEGSLAWTAQMASPKIVAEFLS